MTTVTEDQRSSADALANLDKHMWGDLASKLTCHEAETVHAFLRNWADDENLADEFLALHAEDDDEGDQHYREDHE